MSSRMHSAVLVLLMISGSLLGAFSALPEPVEALTKEVSTTVDMMGSGDNVAVLDDVIVEDGIVHLANNVYPIHDVVWSDANTDAMVVDNDNKPKLGRASHWITRTGFDNTGDYQHSAVWDRTNAQVLVYGGRHDQGATSFIHNNLWSYDPTSHAWRELAPVNRAKILHSAVWADSYNMMIVWGGLTLESQALRLLNETMVYWPANDSWALMAPNPYGGRVGQAAVWDSTNNQMLVSGGTPDGNFSNSTNDLYAFRPVTNSWHRLAPMPANQARGGHAAVWDTQSMQMIVMGGRKSGNAMTSVFSYKPTTNTWTPLGNAPVDRWFHSASWDSVGNKMYSFGGLNSGNQLSARLFEYTPQGDSWKQLEIGPDARYWTAFVWDPVDALGLNFAGAASLNNPITSYNDVAEYRTEVPFVNEGWLTSSYFDVGGILSVGEISWIPSAQPSGCGPDAVKFQVASSSTLEVPSHFVGPDGTPATFFTDPSGMVVGDHHFGGGRIAYRMYFHTDDNTISPSIDTVDMSVIRYASSGTYTSPVYDLGQTTSSLERVTYRSELPTGSNPNLVTVTVRIRTSMQDDMQASSAWEIVNKDDTKFTIPYGRFFQFEVVIKTDTHSRHLTPVFKGITVEYNSPPILTLGLVDRPTGDRTSWFTYAITYTDVDNDEPTMARLHIDADVYDMSSGDTDFTDGAVFRFSTLLDLGEHTYWFEFSDGKNTVRDPLVGEFTGPEVLNRPPKPVISDPSTGTRFTPDEPVQFSGTQSSDPDEDKLTYLWTSNLDGELDAHSTFITKLTEGSHVITLEVTDSHGSKNFTQIALLVKPYLPFLEVRDVYIDKTNPIEQDTVTVTAVIYNDGEARASPAVVELMVDQVVMDTAEESLGVGDKLTLTFQWTAEGERVFIGIRTRISNDAEPDDELFRSINVTANSPPVVLFDLSDLEITEGKSVTFVNNGTIDPNGDSMTYLWDYGDGTTSTEVTTMHVFNNPGIYFVNVTVTDKRGDSTTEQYIISVKEKEKDDEPGFPAAAALAAVVGAAALIAMDRRRR